MTTITQASVEALTTEQSNIEIAQSSIEVLTTYSGASVAQSSVEVLTTEQSNIEISLASIEALTKEPLEILLRTLGNKLGVAPSSRAVCKATNTRSLRNAWRVAYE